MTDSPIKFGTDGWRAIIADEFTFANVRACAQGTAQYIREAGLAERGIVVGYDTRFASDRFAAAVAEVMAANEIRVYLADRAAPTPVIGHAIVARKAAGSVVITASHNPAEYSGFKVRTEYAGAAPPDILATIERFARATSIDVKSMPLPEAETRNLVERFDPREGYLGHITELVDLERIKKAGLSVVVDSMHGAGAGYFTDLLSGGTTTVLKTRGELNPNFPGMHNPEPIARNLSSTSELVREQGAQVALATDGDADRIGVIDGAGKFVDQLLTYGLLAYYLLDVRGLRGPMVKSVTTTRMIEKLGELYDVPVHETPVGFKHLGPKMLETDALIAGEESGGFAFRGHLPERDGILSGLYILDLLARRNKQLPELVDELFEKVGPHYYDRIDVTMTAENRAQVEDRLRFLEPTEVAGVPVTGIDRVDGLRFTLEGGGWALIRLSGTEPLMRIYTEVGSEQLVKPVLDSVRELTGV